MKVDDIKELRNAYRRLFDTRDGKLVLEDLKRLYYDSPLNGEDLSREVGQRDVVRKILSNIKGEK